MEQIDQVMGSEADPSTEISSEAGLSQDEMLRDWYSSQHLIKFDLIGDLVGRELFAIHGDSLLLHCITEAKVDFLNGPQVLHAVHAVEAFLQKLKEHGCHYHIVWFEADKALWKTSNKGDDQQSKYLLVRAILIEHLNREAAIQNSGAQLPFSFVFPSMSSVDFDKYLAENAVRNFMIHDGARKGDVELENSLAFQGLIFQASCRRYAVAIINYLEFTSSKMATLVVSPSSKALTIDYNPPAFALDDISKALPRASDDSLRRALASFSKHRGESVSAREVVSLACLDEILKADASPATKELCIALVIQLVILTSYTLSTRSSPWTYNSPEGNPTDEKDFLFIAKFSSIAESLITSCDNESLLSRLSWDLFDLVDGRVFHQVFRKLARGVFNGAFPTEASKLFEIVEDLTGHDLCACANGPGASRTPSSADDLAVIAGESKSDAAQYLKDSPPARVLAFSNPVIDPHLQDVKLITANAEPELPARIFQEISHWHNAKRPNDPKHLPKPKGFHALRKNQKFMADTVAYSASLTNAAGKLIEPEIIVAGKSKSGKNTPGPAVQLDWKAALKKQSEKTKQKKSTAKSGKEKALEAAQERQEQKNQEKVAAAINFWAERRREFEKEKDLVKRYLDVMRYAGGLSSDLTVVESEVLLYSCQVLVQLVSKNKDTTGK
jgi:ATP-dependent RNA helicase DDX60